MTKDCLRRTSQLGMGLALVVFSATAALAAGDATRGAALARTWCSTCHIVDRNGTGKDAAPPFPLIAERNAPDQLQPKAFLAAPHPPMPDFNLARVQIDDIVAYLKSLARK
jgi:mono/diheme cytochrome c family protein